jgi:hypothetical protein
VFLPGLTLNFNPPTSTFQVVDITSVDHHIQLIFEVGAH